MSDGFARHYYRRGPLLLIVLVVVLTGAVVAWRASSRLSPVPEVALEDYDPEVHAAIEAARAEVRRQPASAEAWGRLAMLLDQHDLRTEAGAAYTTAETLAPEKPDWPYLHALSLTLDDPVAATFLLRRAAARSNAATTVPRIKLAEVLLEQGQLEEAAGLFLRVTEDDPANARAFLGLGRVAYARGNLRQAESNLRRSLELMLADKPARVLLSGVLERSGRHEAAMVEAARAAQLSERPLWPDPFIERAERLRVGLEANLIRAGNLLDAGRVAEGLSVSEQLTRKYPEAERTWLLLGRALLRLRRYADAETALRKAVHLAPDLVEARLQLGLVLMQTGRDAAASDEFQRAIAAKPNLAAAYLDLGLALAKQGRRKPAIEALRSALDFAPQLFLAHLMLAQVLYQDGDQPAAAIEAQRAARLRPDDPRVVELLRQLEHGGRQPQPDD